MKRACLVATVLLASTQLATAGGYAGLGIGTSPAISDDNDALGAGSRSLRALLGSRWNNFALEGAFSGYEVSSVPGSSNRGTFDAYQASVAGKLSFPLGSGFEVFGRLGLQRTWLNSSSAPAYAIYEVAGNGFLVGGGFEYRFSAGPAGASVFVDYQVNHAKLSGEREEYDFTARGWTLGVTLGF